MRIKKIKHNWYEKIKKFSSNYYITIFCDVLLK